MILLAHPSSTKKHILWKEEEVELLKSLLKQKETIKEISKKLKKSEKAIRRKAERLNLSTSTQYKKNKKQKKINL